MATEDGRGHDLLADESDAWNALPAAARTVSAILGALRASAISIGVGIMAGTAIADWAMDSVPPRRPLLPALSAGLVIALAGAAIGAWLGRLRWRRTRWRLDDVGLRVRRGWLWRTELLIPRSRVQHLDIERGPIERRFNLATLIVHTAGTRTQALRQAGLAEHDAVALRNALIPDAARHGDAL